MAVMTGEVSVNVYMYKHTTHMAFIIIFSVTHNR